MKLDWSHWFYNLWTTVIGGAAASVAAWLATAAGHGVFPNQIPVMNWQSMIAVLGSATVTNLIFYLKKAPAPRDLEKPYYPSDYDTTTTNKE